MESEQRFGNGTRTSTGRAATSVEVPQKADTAKRIVAFLIDGVIAAVVGAVPIVGGLAGAAYLVVRDGLDVEFMEQRSLGKKLMKLRVVRLDGEPMDIHTSARRNWMFGLGALVSVLLFIPIVGWIMIPFVSLAALAISVVEIIKVLTDNQGRRWGDATAGTVVIETDE